jgi:RNA polymerase sigma factor (sigma-70 family)
MPSYSAAYRLIPQLRRIASSSDLPDADLLASFVANRDEEAFATLMRRHGPMVWGVCRRVVGDSHLAEDAFQAAFLVLARRARSVSPGNLVGHWLYGVAYRTALKARGMAMRQQAREKQVEVMPHPSTSPEAAWSDLSPFLDAELSQLPDKYRLPLIFCDLEGRPQRQVARDLNLATSTLTNRLARARGLLAKRLSDRGVVLSVPALLTVLNHQVSSASFPSSLATSTLQSVAILHGSLQGALSPTVAELSEGVIKMFLVAKIKAAAIGVTCLLLTVGVGIGLAPHVHAQAESKPASPKNPGKPAIISDDLQYLRRLSLEYRGVVPTTLENQFFSNDRDAKKRDKVKQWIVADHSKLPVSAMCQSCHQGVELSRWGNVWFEGQAQQFRLWESPKEAKATTLQWAQVPQGEKQALLFSYLGEQQGNSSATVDWHSKNAMTEAGYVALYSVQLQPTEGEFLRRTLLDLLGVPPTALELRYFEGDTDPDKRNKLLKWLLSNPETKKRLIEQMMKFGTDPKQFESMVEYLRQAQQPSKGDRFDRFLQQLLKENKNDGQIFEALSLSLWGRFPTDPEKTLVLDLLSKSQNRTQQWNNLLQAMIKSDQTREHMANLRKRAE